jgi:hypothetical protein
MEACGESRVELNDRGVDANVIDFAGKRAKCSSWTRCVKTSLSKRQVLHGYGEVAHLAHDASAAEFD